MKYTYLLALTAIAVAASTGFSQTSVPIVNPTFNANSVPFGSYTGISGADGTSTLTGWNVSAGSRIIALWHPSTPYQPVAGQDATQYVEDVYLPGAATGATNINQVLTTSFAAGYAYSLTADAAIASGETAEDGDTFFIANSSGTVLASTVITGLPGAAWTQFTVTFTSTGLLDDTGAIEIGYASPEGQPAISAGMDIDNFALTATPAPEPSSIAIAALGGFGFLGFLCLRRALVMRKG